MKTNRRTFLKFFAALFVAPRVAKSAPAKLPQQESKTMKRYQDFVSKYGAFPAEIWENTYILTGK